MYCTTAVLALSIFRVAGGKSKLSCYNTSTIISVMQEMNLSLSITAIENQIIRLHFVHNQSIHLLHFSMTNEAFNGRIAVKYKSIRGVLLVENINVLLRPLQICKKWTHKTLQNINLLFNF